MNAKRVKKIGSISVSPIGRVRKTSPYEGYLEINKPFRGALQELDGFSHINVLWWCHLSDDEEDRKVTTCKRPYKKAPASVGTFATRSARRPNPVALTVVPVIEIDHNKGIINIPYIDAEDNTPIIDIKPYHPATDRVKRVSVPDWCKHWPKWYEDSARFDWEDEFVTAR
jgi:tRNA-Thr(GGU) m(6)t(6)A37 methyltransferase TsaA